MQQGRGQTEQAPAGRGQAPGGPAQGQAAGGRGGTPPPPILPEYDAAPIMAMAAPQLVQLLKNPSSTYFQKAIACKKLAAVGGPDSIPVLASYLNDPQMGHYARFGLEPNPSPQVDEALRAALPKLKGRLLMGVIHSIGLRKDARALDALGKLMYDSDVEVAQASAASLGTIGGAVAGKLLLEGLTKAAAPVRPVVARAALVCAEGLMRTNRAQGLELYTALTGTAMPKVVRRVAFREINAAASA